MTSDVEKPLSSPGRGRLAFLRTKRAIAALSVLVIVSIILIVLGATNELTPHSSSSSNSDNNGDNTDDSNDDPTSKPGNWRPANSSSIADGTPLRIMCLGASIIRGEFSDDDNGFRDTFRADLAKLGAPINMVGSQRFGNMTDNDLEAYGGNRIQQIHEHAKAIVPKQRPNVFIINVGTNNVLQRRDTDVAGAHMEAFIDYLLSASPRATVVLSTLLTNTVPDREPLILDINQQFRDVFQKYTEQAVVLAELHPSEGLPGRPQVEDIGKDGSHPTDHGYEIMGHLLAEAVLDADARGYLRWPENGNGLAYDGERGRLNATKTSTTKSPSPKTTKSASKTTTIATTTTTPSGESVSSRVAGTADVTPIASMTDAVAPTG
ncbi:SGNH hydrolase-type esterase domain-containing protein [Nemania abortiva]|nr:SGNH hydrolase-type esterase domain-containing protein [Nemania abortiva]